MFLRPFPRCRYRGSPLLLPAAATSSSAVAPVAAARVSGSCSWFSSDTSTRTCGFGQEGSHSWKLVKTKESTFTGTPYVLVSGRSTGAGGAHEGSGVLARLDLSDGSMSLEHEMAAEVPGANLTNVDYCTETGTAYFATSSSSGGVVQAFKLADSPGEGADGSKVFRYLNEQPALGDGTCFVAVGPTHHGTPGGCVTAANYTSGNVVYFETAADGSLMPGYVSTLPGTKRLGELKGNSSRGLLAYPNLARGAAPSYPGAVPARQDQPHPACFLSMGQVCGLVCDLGSDEILLGHVGPQGQFITIDRAELPPGTGPSRLATRLDKAATAEKPSEETLYACGELNSTMMLMDVNKTALKIEYAGVAASTLPTDYSGPPTTISHLELSPCGNWAFVGNRIGVGVDGSPLETTRTDSEGAISVMKLSGNNIELADFVSSGGQVPQSFCVVPRKSKGSALLVVGNKDSNSLVSFFFDENSGELKPTGHSLEVQEPMCVKYVEL